MPAGIRKIVAVMQDLMFMVKITETAKRSGFTVQYVKSPADALASAQEMPQLVIMDLNHESSQQLALIEQLKSNPETQAINLVGFLSHVQAELKQKALEAGCDVVLARSAFSTNLPQLLKRHAS